jgi:D-xylose transport system substrate-binding protein
MMKSKKVLAGVAAAALILVACGSDDEEAGTTEPAPGDTTDDGGTSAPGGTDAADGDCVVGVSWNNYQEERWAKWDEPALKAAIEAGGGTYVSNDAKSSAETQATNLDNLISQGANVLVVLAQDGTAIKPAVTSALEQGVPVIAYDRLIEDPGALYLTFDNIEVGRIEARAIFEKVPTGNYVIIKGNSADANADFLREGYEDVIGEAVAAGDITIVGETYTDNWDPAIAQASMEQYLTANDNDIQAVLSENDGMAGGVIAALDAQGLAGQIPVSGQDAEQAALNRVALGTQTLTVWKDSRELGTVAGEAAIALCADPTVANVPGTATFTTPGGIDMTSNLLVPQPITQENLDLVIDAGWISQEDACAGVDAGAGPACG